MPKVRGFTLIELLVVIAIIALLMAILMPALGRTKRQAQAVVCQSNLRHWSLIFQMYQDDNEGKFSGGEETVDGFVEHVWVLYLKPYFETFDILLCPLTKRTWCDGFGFGKDVAWDFRCRDEFELPDAWYWYYDDSYGSYGKNSWCSQWEHGACPDPPGGQSCNWLSIDSVTQGNRIPVLLDANWLGGFPTHLDDPPPYDGEFNMGGREIGRYCIDRHDGAVNVLFLDWSARRIDLKQLWKLKWHRLFNLNGPWTIASFGGSEAACAAAWDSEAPWMKSMPEY